MKKYISIIAILILIMVNTQTAAAMKYTYTKTGALSLVSISEGKYVNFQYDNNGNLIGKKNLSCKPSEYKLMNVNSNKALDVFAGNTTNGTKIQIESDNGTDAQRWLLCNTLSNSFKLINVNSG
ncbi:RICIN domain-containing protein, partial [Paenibacillus sonchi]|uniref:RICIN domain-containing protein n=1 Tax=Paenibacillus sonchi TaxID=373687 RepID=UPI0005856B70